jgi:hypothetical protein
VRLHILLREIFRVVVAPALSRCLSSVRTVSPSRLYGQVSDWGSGRSYCVGVCIDVDVWCGTYIDFLICGVLFIYIYLQGCLIFCRIALLLFIVAEVVELRQTAFTISVPTSSKLELLVMVCTTGMPSALLPSTAAGKCTAILVGSVVSRRPGVQWPAR